MNPEMEEKEKEKEEEYNLLQSSINWQRIWNNGIICSTSEDRRRRRGEEKEPEPHDSEERENKDKEGWELIWGMQNVEPWIWIDGEEVNREWEWEMMRQG
jgi:hypothetical protein